MDEQITGMGLWYTFGIHKLIILHVHFVIHPAGQDCIYMQYDAEQR